MNFEVIISLKRYANCRSAEQDLSERNPRSKPAAGSGFRPDLLALGSGIAHAVLPKIVVIN